MTYFSNLLSLLLYLLVYGNVMSDDRDTFFVTEGDSVTLQYYMRETQDQDIRIIHDKGYSIDSCTFTDHLTCRFDHKGLRDRLKVYENGSLTITNTKVTDSGDYDITTFFQSHVRHRTRSYSVVVRGFFSFDTDGVSVMEGDSVTLHTGVLLNQEQKIRWYFNQTEIARILEYDPFHHSRICTDVQCNNDTERFRDRLKLDHQTGSLTIRDITNTDSGFYDLLINSVWDNHHFIRYSSRSSSNTKIFIVAVHGVSAAERHKMKRKSVKEGESVTLDTRVKKYPRHLITWYFNDIIIAVINGVQSKICTDERFRDRLKLDHQTGSLTIKNTRTTDSGFYKLQIRSSRFTIMRSFSVSASSYSVDSGKVSVMEGDLVTLHTAVETNQQEEIRWRFNDMLIAGITGDLSFICTDVQCNNPAERFRDRLKLDHQTGSLTIRDITITDSGDYTLEINSSSSIQRNVSVTVTGVSAAERDKMKRKSVKEGESVTLDTHVINKPDIMWHFNETVITGDQCKICTDFQCKDAEERFRDRLKMDHQTGSLTITDTRTTDSGLYKLQITSYSTIHVTSVKSFSVTVTSNVMSDDSDTLFVTEGDSFTLKYDMRKTQNQDILLHHDGIGYPVGNCIYLSCEYANREFRDRLKVNENGSLTITNTTVTDSGDYGISIYGGHDSFRIGSYSVVVRVFFSFDTDGVSVMEGDSVTLHTGVLLNQEEKIRDQIIPKKRNSFQIELTTKITWYFNQTAIARILEYNPFHHRRICTDVLCNKGNERFRDRLKLDRKTGSLTIRDIRTTDSGLYDLLINWDHIFSVRSTSSNTKIFIVAVHDVPAAERHKMKRKSVKEGESITLDTHVTKNPNNSITWYFNDIRIAVITGDQSEICSVERFRDRLKLDHQTGSLTITNTTNTDSGLYKLQIRSSRFTIIRSFSVSAASYSVDSGKVSLMEGDSITFHTDVETNQQEEIRWRFNKILIAEIIGDLSFICIDVQCNNYAERFRDRLKLDHQTGSLTIIDIRTTDSGDYTLEINSSSIIQRNVSVTVTGVSAAERDKMKTKSVKEGESVTLDTYVINKPDIMWHFNKTVITGDQCKICTDVQCEYSEERFRDRLKLDNQTGSLTITNTRITDSGLYKLQITSYSTIRVTSVKSFSVTVTGVVPVSVRTRDSLTLRNNVKTNQQEEIRWYFNDTVIAEITDDLKICTNVWCKERFKDRLKLEEFGSLAIMNIRTEDAGEYKLMISGSIVEIFYVSVTSYSVDSGKVSVKEGYSVTLHTDVETNQQEEIRWHFNKILIAGITGLSRYNCKDIQCNKDVAERFRDRLQLQYRTGSLTITNIRTTDSGDYELQIINSSNIIKRTVGVNVTGVSAAERDEMKRKSVKEGESVTLDTHVINKPDNLMWHFDEIVITGDQSNICTDVQCEYSEERFRDRLKLNNQTGSLTITNTRITDSGLYKLQITSYSTIRVTSEKSFSVTVIGNVMSDDRDTFFVTEGDSFTLKYYMREELWDIWMYHDGERYSIRYCRHHNWCISDYEGFGDRLEGNQNGPLTITNTKVTDSGDYRIETRFGNRILYSSTVVVRGFFSFDTDGVSVMEGDSVTLHTGVLLNQEEKISDQIIPTKKISAQIKVTAKIRWYFNKSAIVRILGDLSYICTDVLCNKGNERFRDRLKLDHQTGSLTIRDIRTTDSGLYDLLINWDNNHSSSSSSSKRRIESWQRRSRMWRRTSNTKIFIVAVHGVSDAERHEMKRKSVKEGESVTLDTRVIKNPHNSITWYFNDIGIAVITRDQSEICSVDRYRDRLKLDHQTGSLTITNITNTDSGLYKLQIRSSRFTIMRSFIVSAVSYSVDSGKVSVMEGDSVTLHTDVETNQQEEIRWRFNKILIAEISGDLSFICTDVQCNNEGTERFRDRLKLDHQTGSLTIRDIRTTDSGDYTLEINSSSSIQRNVSFSVTGVSAAERDEMKRKSVKEGETVTLDTYVINKPDNLMWHFNETIITGDQCKIYTDVQCEDSEERFRDRLKLDNQTGSLTITNTRTTDSGLYKLQITSYSTIRVTSVKSFSVTVTGIQRDWSQKVKRQKKKDKRQEKQKRRSADGAEGSCF